MSALNESFWNFCLQTWSDKTLAERLIKASIEEHTDVVLVLFFVWTQQQQYGLSAAGTIKIEQLAEVYRPLIEAYRSLRRQSKDVVANKLYQAQKSLELLSERCYANELCDCIDTDEVNIASAEVISLSNYDQALARHLTQVIDSEPLKP
ncbi:DUF2390 domain-containing protein [uncultured Umboniibacter sp.]|uniref:DUF2390 domain-containing protein n=1 Tax=uncultured Umboniibacter sp. TaxID=1798917 RepID=UPI0026189655|nr:DUF2390 domain-containing protein [uncultured Umboniibacter sp.]